MSLASIVIPCFNEAKRLDLGCFREFHGRQPGVDFLFVNDGSSDDTHSLLRELESDDPKTFSVLSLAANVGKAEAVRLGMLKALEREQGYAGYWDADLATPLDEIPRFLAVLEETPSLEVVFGSRVQLLGREIQRSPARHYAGRIFATLASLTLGLAVYDTQCGAKLFRSSGRTRQLFAEPFCTNWVFDVEIIARLLQQEAGGAARAADVILELPLQSWADVAGSKVGALDFPRALLDLLRIRSRYFSSVR